MFNKPFASLILFLAFASQALSADVAEKLTPGALSFTGGASFTNAVLKVRGPNDYSEEKTARRGLPVFRITGGRMQDGVYFYALSAATDEEVPIKKKVDNGRGTDARDFTLKPFYKEGMFRITRGLIEPVTDGAERDEG